ncbi:MAG: peroxiredoxin [Phenylobacterium zucineum]|nr:MAG: peroxiredoxin [Phenylobacterium zucineum]
MSDIIVGQPAPDFTLAGPEGDLTLASFKGRGLVLYFYPKDDTPGCTKEAQGFSEMAAEFEKAGVAILGVSKDSVASHAKFIKKYDLSFALGSDPEGATLEAYGAWVEKSMYGRQYMGIDRSTFLIDRSGVLAAIWRKVKVSGHVIEVLKAAQSL